MLFNKCGEMNVILVKKLFILWLCGNISAWSKRLNITNVMNEANIIDGSSLMSLFFQKEEKLAVFSKVKNITNPLIIKKNSTPICPYLKKL